MTMTQYGFGAVTRAQVENANDRITSLYDALSIKRAAIEAAERAGGFVQREIDAAYTMEAALSDEVTSLGPPPALTAESGAWGAFVRRLVQVEQRVAAFDPASQFQGGRRTKMLIGATLGTLAIVGLLTWGLWRYSGPRRGTAGLRGSAFDEPWHYGAWNVERADNDKQWHATHQRTGTQLGPFWTRGDAERAIADLKRPIKARPDKRRPR